MTNGGFRAETMYWIFDLLFDFITPAMLESLSKFLLGALLIFALIKSKTKLGKLIAIIITFMVTSNYISPQWNLWLVGGLLLLTNIPVIKIFIFDLITVIEFPYIWGICIGLTNFDHNLFNLNNPYNLAFIILNLLRYAFLFYFFYKSVTDKNLVNKKLIKNLKNFLNYKKTN
jgi:hypothetical protein